jgi:hypothetical protein
MPPRSVILLVLLAAVGAGCTSSGLSGGGSKKKGSSSKDSGTNGGELGNKTNTDKDSTSTDEDVGSNDAGDYAEPTNVAGAYLACRHEATGAGEAEFACKVFHQGVADGRAITSIEEVKATGQEADSIDLTANVHPTDPTTIRAKVVGNAMPATDMQIAFGISLKATFADGESASLETPCSLYVPSPVFAAAPNDTCGTEILSDGQTLTACAIGMGNPISVQWSNLPGVDSKKFKPSLVLEKANGDCDIDQKVETTFTDDCECSTEPGWAKGRIGFATVPSGDICFAVEAQAMVCGVPKKVTVFAK